MVYFSLSLLHVQTSTLCKQSGLALSSDSVALLRSLGDQNMAAVVIHNPLLVQRNTYISVQLPEGLCTQVITNITQP